MARIVFILIGALLAVTASAKLWMLLTDPFADVRVGLPQEVLWLAVVTEFALAIFNLRSSRIALLSMVNLVVFAGLAIFGLSRWTLGYQDCGCSGSFALPVWLFIGIDISIVTTLLLLNRGSALLRNGVISLICAWTSLSSARQGQIAGLGVFAIAVLVLQLPVAKPLRAAVFGDPSISARVKIDGDLAVGVEAFGEVEIRNLSSFDARVIGIARSCRCFDFEQDPNGMLLPANSRTLRRLVIKPRIAGPLYQRLELFLDCPEQFRVNADLIGHVSGAKQ